MVDMSSIVSQATTFLNTATGGNQMIAGAISLWFLGVASYLARGIPAKLVRLTRNYMITTMTFNNGGYDEAYLMYNFMAWLRPRLREGLSRTISIQVGQRYRDESTLGVGYGTHFFFYNKRLFWLHKSKLDSSGSERQKEEISIGTLGRSHEPFRELLKEFAPKEDKDKIGLYRTDSDGDWCRYATPPKRTLESLALDSGLRDTLISQINHFKSHREWFYDRGLPYKLAYILHGQPGTGKTSLIKAIASHFEMNLCTINIHSMTDSKLELCLATTPANSIVVIEDFDSSPATKDRSSHESKVDKDTSNTTTAFSFLTLTGILNALDGVNPLDDVIIFMTTNYLEHVDEAMYRKGRIDYTIEVPYVNPVDVVAYAERMFPGIDLSRYDISETRGCLLNEAMLEAKDDPTRFVASLRNNDVLRDKREVDAA